MIEWQDIGVITKAVKFSEDSLILDIFTKDKGLTKGIVKYATRGKKAGAYQIGNLVEVNWHARLPEHLGTFSLEVIKSYSSKILHNYFLLEGLSTVCASVSACLPEREAFRELFGNFHTLLQHLTDNDDKGWAIDFVLWEKDLLEKLGFGLDLSHCAVTGKTKGLAFVSPKTGKAVTEEAAGIWKPKLLPLPTFMSNEPCQKVLWIDILQGLDLTGFFLQNNVFDEKTLLTRSRFYSLVVQKVEK